jgi:hypothetical protein
MNVPPRGRGDVRQSRNRKVAQQTEPQSLDCATPQVSAAKLAASKELAVGLLCPFHGERLQFPKNAARVVPTQPKTQRQEISNGGYYDRCPMGAAIGIDSNGQ